MLTKTNDNAMLCHFSITLTITHFDPRKCKAIRAAIESTWDFDDFCNEHEELYAYGEAALNIGTEKEFYRRIAKAVFESNGSHCEIQIEPAYLENPPLETCTFGMEQYCEMAGTT